MHSLESGIMDARTSSSMHPLWSQYVLHRSTSNNVAEVNLFFRYIFPAKPSIDAVIDLTEDEVYFYMNPYSGEMSLEFPKAEKPCRGGILA